MAEPNHNAEDLLKRYAAERRERAPKELHPASRRALQGEVARVYGRDAAGLPWWRKLIAPRFAWGLALVGILAVSLLTLRQPAPPATQPNEAKDAADVELEVALDKRATEQPVAKEELAFAPSPTDRFLKGEAAGGRSLSLADAESESKQRVEQEEVRGRERLLRDAPAVAATAPPPAPSAAPAGQAIRFSNFSAESQAAARPTARAAVAKATSAAPVVLDTFTLLQSGTQLQVTDADGSLYRGIVLTQQPAQNAYAFKVAGTNNTLQQPVTFTGQVVQLPERADANRSNAQSEISNSYLRNQQLRLQGQAVVGENATVNVDAQNTTAPAQK